MPADAPAWRWPLAPPITVLRGFQPPPAPWEPGHRGIDLAASPGQTVYAAGSGEITYAGTLAGRGVVAVTHDQAAALRTTYVPVRAAVLPGSRVSAGAKIGTVEGGTGHCGPRACLHWGLLRDKAYHDPLGLLCRPMMRLFPVWPSRAAPARLRRAGASTNRRPSPASTSGHKAPGRSLNPHDGGRPAPSMTLSGAGDAGGGAVIGMLVTLSLAFLWGQLRQHRPTRPLPPEVIDLTQERKRRRTHRASVKGDSSA
jgi:murein DD-endopeptidase MepM/ murein hydrolase activator NlpD